MKPKISIIVPVYNVESYIGNCIQSLLEQTYENIEVILINDGSIDKSGIICEEYMARDARISVLHQNNLGVSAARNKGINIARGDYIGFVDADDYVEPDMYEYLLSLCQNFHVKIAQCDRMYTYKTYDKREIVKNKKEKLRIIDCETALHELLCSKDVRSSLWSKLYKKELFDNVRLDTQLTAGEDLIVNYQLIKKTNRIVVSNRKCYFYYQRKGSCTTGALNEKIYKSIIQTKNYSEMEKSIKLKKSWTFNIAVKSINYLRRGIIQNKLEHFDELRKYIVDANGVLLQPLKYRVKNDRFIQLHILLIWIAPRLYRKVVNFKNN